MTNKKYKHLFFDLDHTLWDFAANEKQTLSFLFEKYNLNKYFAGYDDFFAIYAPINSGLWLEYRTGIKKKQDLKYFRFINTFQAVGFNDVAIAKQFADEWIAMNSQQTALTPYAREVLDYLFPKYEMYIITNGFIETQYAKLERSKLRQYFKKVYISEEIGYQKPKREFFEYAIKSSNACKAESLVIGDNMEVDILGAIDFGLDQVYFNPDKIPHEEKIFKEISSLLELKEFL